jgi:hypothetical protein
MNKLFSKRLVTIAITIVIATESAMSQLFNVDILRSAPADAVKFVEAYINPWANAFGAGLNGSWYNTAKPHKLGGFDITTGLNVGIVPTSAQTFDISSLGLSSSITGTGITPTVAGAGEDGPLLTYSQGGVTLASFHAPPGAAWRYIPVPTLQVGVGLPMGTELKLRYMPTLSFKDGDGKMGLWGVGLVHSIMQYIPGNKLLPIDVSLFGGYTKLTGNVPLGLLPDPLIGQNYVTINPATAFLDQNLKASISALNVSVIASVNIPVVSFYGGLGYSKTRTVVELSGKFPTPSLVVPAAAAPYAQYNDSGVMDGSDFEKIEIPNFSGLRANIGLRLKLAVITIHADYTRAQYNVVSAGLGISFR